MAALIIGLLLIVYPNMLAFVAARRAWDQWNAFMVGNLCLIVALSLFAWAAGTWSLVWGRLTTGGVWLGVLGGALPLAVILALTFAPGQLGRDIVTAGVGSITTRRFIFRLCVQVGIATVCCEELAFRGVLQVELSRVIAVPWTIVGVAAAYGLWHAVLQYNGFASRQGVARVAAAAGGTAIYTLLGLLLAIVRQAAGGLAAPLIAHGVLDVLMFAGMYVRRRQLDRV